MNGFLPSHADLGQHVGLQPRDVGQHPGHPEVVHLVIDHHGDGGRGAYHNDDRQEDVGVDSRSLEL